MLALRTHKRQLSNLETHFPAINALYDSDTVEVVVAVYGYQSGRAKRDGVSWKVICRDPGMAFAPGDRAHVVGKVQDRFILVIEPLKQ